MSTTIKRVALVAVAALGLGVVSVAPSQATVSSLTITVTNGTATTLASETTTAAVIDIKALFDDAADSITVTASELLIPTDAVSPVANLSFLETTTSTKSKVSKVSVGAGTQLTLAKTDSVTIPSALALASTDSTGYRGAKLALQLASGSGTITGGTYTYTVIVKSYNSGTGTPTTTVKDVSIVVTAPSTLADATSTSIVTAGYNTADPKDYLTDSVTVASKSIPTAVHPVAVILVTQKNADTKAVPSEAMTAVITGPGTIAKGADYSTAGGLTAGAGRALTLAKGDYVAVFADGTSGEATITITGNKSGVVLGVEKVTFFDTKPASATVAVKKAFVAASTTATESVFLVTIKDAAGNPIKDLKSLTAAATDTSTTQVVGGASTCSATYNATKGGFYCDVKGLSATKFGKVNYTFTATGLDALATVVTATADVTFSSAVAAKITIVPAVASANPGDIVTYTYTAVDANGFAVPDASYNLQEGSDKFAIFSDVVASGFATGFAPFAVGDTITTVNGVATSKGTLAIAGTAKITWTLAGSTTAPADTTSLAKALNAVELASADVTISNPGVDAATDAANEAAQAASDATDAALAAADAADAATTKAQEAVDAVATLSAQVSKLITALKAQITTLTNLVIKIQKKVKA